MKKHRKIVLVTFALGCAFNLASAAAETFRDCSNCPQMVVVPAGSFLLGSKAYPSERPITKVIIPKPFAVGKFEITFDQWAACFAGGGCQSNPSPSDNGWGRGNRPVIFVKWVQTQEYIAWLNTKISGNPYRLLTEAEWEYAARADRTGEVRNNYSWGNSITCKQANFGRRRASACEMGQNEKHAKTQPVGSYQPNQFGLYDMHGNVWEWVQDCWHYNYRKLPDHTKTQAAAWQSDDCTFRVIRGGSWVNEPSRLRSSNRSRLGAVNRDINYGFRIAKTLR